VISGNAYVRHNTIGSINGDDSDYQACEIAGGVTLCEGDDDGDSEGETTLTPVHFSDYQQDTLFSTLSTINPEDIDGTYNTGLTELKSRGVSLAVTHQSVNGTQISLGLSTDHSEIVFNSATEFAILHNDTLADDRSVSPIGLYDADGRVGLNVDSDYYSIFANLAFDVNEQLALELGARYQHADIDMLDLIETGPGSLNGHHNFSRLNPAIGLRFQVNSDITSHLSYSESSRNPSPAELSCADENDPCKLPNGFVSDPPLKQVVVNTWEVGVIHSTPEWQHQLTLFNTKSRDDIIFQQAGNHPARGYFINIEQTRRRGVELSSSGEIGKFGAKFDYSYLDATFESPFVSFSPQNPLGANRDVRVGSRIPGQPKHQVKANLEYQWHKLRLATEFNYVSSSYYRGDEANENKKIASYTLTNLVANLQLNPTLVWSLRIDNVFNRRYFTFGTYGEADEVLGDVYPGIDHPYFVGPAKPRSVTLSLNISF